MSITTPIPLTPTLLSPANGSTHPADPAFSWTYTAGLAGNTMTGYVLRYKQVGASAYSYYSGTWGSPSSTPVVISATSPGVSPASGTFPVGVQYQWSVANVDQGGQSAFPPDALWTSQAPPTVTITAPTGGTFNGAQTTITWTATAASTASIASTRCVVTDPSNKVIADSGTVGGGATSFTTPSTLHNGTTYTITVTATDTSGESTTVSIGATAVFDGPAMPRCWAIPTFDGDGVPCVQITATSMDNQLSTVDSSFEGASTGDWFGSAYCTLSSGSVAKDGLSSLKLTCAGGGTAVAITPYGTSGVPVNPGQLYCASAFFSAASTTRSCYVGINWYNASGTTIGSTSLSAAVTDTAGGAFVQATEYAVAPSTAAFAAVVVEVAGAAASEVHYVDEVMLVAGAPLGSYTKVGTHVVAAEPVFTPYDVGCYFSGTNSAGSVTECAPTMIQTFVSPTEVILASAATASGAAGYIGPYVGGNTGLPPQWSLGSPTSPELAVQAYDYVTSDTRWVRFASVTNPLSIVSGGTYQVLDYEASPQHGLGYTPAELATNSGAPVSTYGNQTFNVLVLVTDRLWIFDPLEVASGGYYVDVTMVSGSLSRGEYISPHKQVGNPYLAMISDTVGGIDGSLNVRVQGAARWLALIGGAQATDTALATRQATVCISDPLGGIYYGRLGIAPGGTSSGSASALFTGSYVQADIANQVRDVALTFVAQAPPAT